MKITLAGGYRLVTARSEHDMVEQVSNLLSKGWRLYGSPSVSISGNSYGTVERYIQAMVMDDQEKET